MVRAIKQIFMCIRTSVKFLTLLIVAACLILAVAVLFYKQTYSVSLNGEFIGYTEDKSSLQKRINQYIENGEKENVAFVQISQMPQYELCLLKKNITANDEEIYQKVIETGTAYYKYYAVTDSSEEKVYMENFGDAEKVLAQLKEKDSQNKDDLAIVEKYEKEEPEYTNVDSATEKLYEKKPEPKKVIKVARSSSGGAGMYATGLSNSYANLGISLANPVSGTITSRFGVTRPGHSHKGIDIGAARGTSIKAAAAGTVTYSSYGYNGGYGNYLIIDHGNGISTAYGHCDSLAVSAGTYVSQGQLVARVGNTGNSFGNHLHFEVRVNGVSYNPLNYVY